MTTIQDINARIHAKGNQMAAAAKAEIVKIATHTTQQTNTQAAKDVPARPWLLTGGACVATSVVGTIFSDSKWPLLVGAAGLLSFGIGFTKSKQSKSSKANTISNATLDTEKAFIIEKCNALLDAKKAEWDSFMASIKSEVQGLINNASLPEAQKEDFLSQTYYPESLSMSTLSLIDKFDTTSNTPDFTNRMMSKKADFANEVALSIIQTTNAQIQIYSHIAL